MPDVGFLPSLQAYARLEPYAESSSAAAGARTSSLRYSYASTLHDLDRDSRAGSRAEEAGGGKKWMKSRAQDGRWSNMFAPRPPEDFFPPGSRRPPSIAPREPDVDEESEQGSEYATPGPGRTLRKYATDIPVVRAAAAEDAGATPRAVPFPTTQPGPPPGGSGGTGWGLGFMGNWWSATAPSPLATSAPVGENEVERVASAEEDFQMGEDGTPLNFMDTPPALPSPGQESASRDRDQGASSTRESSPFSAALEAAANSASDADSTSASVAAAEVDSAEIGVAITTPVPTPTPVLANSVSALILAPLAGMSIPRHAAKSEYPSLNPYQLRKSLIRSRTSLQEQPQPQPAPTGAAGSPTLEQHPLPTSTSCLSPLDRLLHPTTQAQRLTTTQEEASSDGSAIGSSQSPPTISTRHLAPVPALRLAPETYTPSPTESATTSPSQRIPLAPYNTISSSIPSTPLTLTPTTDEGSSRFPSGSRGPSLEQLQERDAYPPPQDWAQPYPRTSRELRESTNPQAAHHSSVIIPPPRPSSSHLDCQSTCADTACSQVPLPGPRVAAVVGAQGAIAESSMSSPQPKEQGLKVAVASKSKHRSAMPAAMWILGWVMPWCWILGGWVFVPALSNSIDLESAEKGTGAEGKKRRSTGWIAHPDPWVRACRVCAVVVLPTVAVLAVAAVIVLAVLR